MGTNFYLHCNGNITHIGKRSSAGPYCYECNVSFCLDGNEFVHMVEGHMGTEVKWSDSCPMCGKKDSDSIGMAYSFSWALFPWLLKKTLLAYKNIEYAIKDECGKMYTDDEFWSLIANAPIQYFHSIGDDFC